MSQFVEHLHPRDTSGKWAPKAHSEPGPSAALTAVPSSPMEMNRAAFAAVEDLVARHQGNGVLAPAERQDDVEEHLRAACPHLPEEQFEYHLGRIGAAAEKVSTMERIIADGDETDTGLYRDLADEVDLEEDDFPVARGDYSPGGGYIDCEAYANAVREAHDDRLDEYVSALVTADADARNRTAAPRGA